MSARIDLTAEPETVRAHNRVHVVARVNDADGRPVADGVIVHWMVAGQAHVEPKQSRIEGGAASAEVTPTGDVAPDTLTVTAETDEPIAMAAVTIQVE